MAEHAAGDEGILSALEALCHDGPFEVMRAAMRTLAEIDQRQSAFELLKSHFNHPNWRIREAVTYSLQRYVERGILSPEAVQESLEELLVTSSGFVPHFQLRNQIRELSKTLEQLRESGCSST